MLSLRMLGTVKGGVAHSVVDKNILGPLQGFGFLLLIHKLNSFCVMSN